MKSMKKLIPAIAMLIISAVLMSTASYAWFSMSREVSATGITMTAKAPTNLLISTDDGTSWADTATFDETYTGKLYPASSSDGKTFHAVVNDSYIGDGIGGIAEAGTVFMKDSDVIAVNGANNGWYAVYTLALKTTGEDNVTVSLASVEATPIGTDTLDQCVRVSIYDSSETLIGIWAVDDDQAVVPVSTVTYNVDEFTSYTLNDDDVLVANTITLAANTSETLTVRVWIEGENPNCVNAVAGQDFEIGLTFTGVDA